MSLSASALPRRNPRLGAVARRWPSHLSQRIVATKLATAALSFLAALLATGPAIAQADATLWVRIGVAIALAAITALVLAGLLSQMVGATVNELRRVVEAGWALCGLGAMRGERQADVHADEITRLSGATRRLVETLADRVAMSEDLAADLAHEIRNPLTSLRAAAEALRRSDEDQRARLVDIIEQDVARLDRLVGEISSTSRLDAELVRERAADFDLLAMIRGIVAHMAYVAAARGVEIISDLPTSQVRIVGLEPRLAQVVINVIENAVSLCEMGDAVRVWVRTREARVLVVVEDTGPGIPDGEAEKIFRRFYSHRPADQFGDHSGLGLAISRQIVEAHDGLIWAENIRPTESDILSEPAGARFVVVLPL